MLNISPVSEKSNNIETKFSKPAVKNIKTKKDDLMFPKLEPFFSFVNGYPDFFSLRDVTKSIWPLYLPLQIIGLVNTKISKLARALYGACWSIIYSCYRPWKHNVKKINASNVANKVHRANEMFRVGMGSTVSLIYGGGGFGMLWGALTNNEGLYEKASDFYQTGMFNQNQIFACMNADLLIRRKYDRDNLSKIDKKTKVLKANVETIDTILFLPNIITRSLDTLRLFGLNLSENLKRIVDSLGYFSYGTWALKYGILKGSKEEGGDLKLLKKSDGKVKEIFYKTQEQSSFVFRILLPGLSWLASLSELLGFKSFAENTFKLEGIMERLNPTIAACSIRDTWLKLFYR